VKWQRIQSCIAIDLAPFRAGSIGDFRPPERLHLTSPSFPLKPPGDIYITATRALHLSFPSRPQAYSTLCLVLCPISIVCATFGIRCDYLSLSTVSFLITRSFCVHSKGMVEPDWCCQLLKGMQLLPLDFQECGSSVSPLGYHTRTAQT